MWLLIFLLINCFLSVSWQFNRCNRMKVLVHTKQQIAAAGMCQYFVISIEVSRFMMSLCLCSLWPWNCLVIFHRDDSIEPNDWWFPKTATTYVLQPPVAVAAGSRNQLCWHHSAAKILIFFPEFKCNPVASYLVNWNWSRIGICHIFIQLIFLLNVTENHKDILSWQFDQCFSLIAGLQSTDGFIVQDYVCLIDKVDSHRVILF